jgi:hypothetical protein
MVLTCRVSGWVGVGSPKCVACGPYKVGDGFTVLSSRDTAQYQWDWGATRWEGSRAPGLQGSRNDCAKISLFSHFATTHTWGWQRSMRGLTPVHDLVTDPPGIIVFAVIFSPVSMLMVPAYITGAVELRCVSN